ncbi:hypothetical protein C4K16_5528 [Pseudomonas chlororaphis subsp. aurantiaca]|nr:hypothetical protein C4K16_5528 [Pseudomonas chlororaphis subsp. aurantiaca]
MHFLLFSPRGKTRIARQVNPVAAAEGCDKVRRTFSGARTTPALRSIAALGSGYIDSFRSRRSPASSSHGCIAMPLRPMSHELCHKRYKVSPALCHNCHRHSALGR